LSPITILLADDHGLVRAGIRALLHDIANVQVVGEAETAEEALALAQQLQPTIVLMDISMPGLGGLEATRRLTLQYPEMGVIILSMHTDQLYIMRALRAGAKGYLLKGARTPELELAIASVARGETYLSPSTSKAIVDKMLRRSDSESNPLDRLTTRQREVLQLIAGGFSSKEIARELGLSMKTVNTHRTDIMEQLGIHDIAGLVRFAIHVGLVTAES
jgi:DNA-binding NarL/FixJ family response regulator